MTQLPLEIWNQIFSNIDNEYDLFFISRVNKQFLNILMSKNFWIYHFHNNYKYAKFNIYNSICEFANIFSKMFKFLNQIFSNVDKLLLFNQRFHNDKFEYKCTVNNIENYNAQYATSKYIIPEIGEEFHGVYLQKTDQNDYCTVIDGYHNMKYFKKTLLIYNKFLTDDNINKYIVLIKNEEPGGKRDCWDFKIYGNYIWYIHEYFNEDYVNINVTFFAKNILTGKIHKIYTYDNEKWGHWTFSDTCQGLVMYKNG